MTEAEDPELPRGIALAWGVAANPQRGPKREMNIERIVDAAVEIADAEGLAAVSMSRVAQSLGYTTMSLYRYVTAKDDLLVLMQEQGIGLTPVLGPDLDPSDWRGRLRAIGRAQLDVYRQHPWLLDVSIRGQIFNLLMDLQRDRGLAYVLVTHELGSAEALADRILVLYLGRVVEEAPKDAFFARPAHPYSIGLLAASKVRADTSGTHRPLVVGDAPSVTDPPPGCPFHPRCWLYERLGRPARCREALPLLDEVRPGQSAACHFAQEAIVSGGDVDGGVGSPVVESRGATVTAAASGGAAAPRGGQVEA